MDLRGFAIRLMLLGVLFVILVAMLVSAGTMLPDPAVHNYPHTDHVYGNAEAYVGESVELGGPVVDTDPIVIRIGRTGGHITLVHTDRSVVDGQHVTVFGVLTDESTLEVEHMLVREPWEAGYMFAISVLAAGWVGIRIVRQWRFDLQSMSLLPRRNTDG